MHTRLPRRQLLTFGALTLLGTFWFGLFKPVPLRWDAVPTFDAVFFVKMAEQILRCGEFGWIGYHEPCLYPLLVAAAGWCTGDLYVAAVAISKVATVLSPGLLYLLGRDLFNERVGIGAALLLLFFPHMQSIAATSQSEALYVCLIILATTLLWKAWQADSARLALCAGCAFAAAYLTRSEGIFSLFFMAAALVVIGRGAGRRALRVPGLALAACLLLVAPYIGYLSSHYGTLTVGTKTSGIYFWVRDKCFHDPDPERREWGLSSGGELNLISMQSRDLMAYWRRDIPRSVRVYLNNFSEQLPGRIPNDGAIKHYPRIFPLYLALPLGAGLLLMAARRRPLAPAGYLAAGFLLLFIYPLLTGGWWRYLINLLPFFLLLTAAAGEEIAERLAPRRTTLAAGLALLLVCGYHVWIVAGKAKPEQVVSYLSAKQSASDDTKAAGAWARRLIPANATYMAQWTRLPFYLEGRWIALPQDEFDAVMRYARAKRVEYLLLESNDPLMALELAQGGIPATAYLGTHANQATNYYCSLLRLQ